MKAAFEERVTVQVALRLAKRSALEHAKTYRFTQGVEALRTVYTDDEIKQQRRYWVSEALEFRRVLQRHKQVRA